MKRYWIRGTLVAGLLSAAMPAMAHMPYILPNLFDIDGSGVVSLEASFTEDAFRPDIAMKDAPFEITGPDGQTQPMANPTLLTRVTVAEAKLPADGLYRISSGQRFGRMGKMYQEGPVWKMVGEGAAPPAGAKLVDVQSATIADAYILRGKPGATGALTARGKALEIHPASDPSAIAAGKPFPIEILYQGKGLANAQVSLFREAGFYDGKKIVGEFKSDASGRISLTPPDAGRYLILVRNRNTAPANAGVPYYSYTVTLAFEAM